MKISLIFVLLVAGQSTIGIELILKNLLPANQNVWNSTFTNGATWPQWKSLQSPTRENSLMESWTWNDKSSPEADYEDDEDDVDTFKVTTPKPFVIPTQQTLPKYPPPAVNTSLTILHQENYQTKFNRFCRVLEIFLLTLLITFTISILLLMLNNFFRRLNKAFKRVRPVPQHLPTIISNSPPMYAARDPLYYPQLILRNTEDGTIYYLKNEATGDVH